MNRTVIGLSALLAVQLLVAGTLLVRSGGTQPAVQSAPLLAEDGAAVTRLVISSADAAITLTKTDDGWTVPALRDLPAAGDKLRNLIGRLHSVATGWPVATTGASHKRFAVASDAFERHVQLYRGDTVAGDLYIGKSPGFKQVYVRRAGEDPVYSVALNAFDFSTEAVDWIDRKLLAAPAVTAVSNGSFSLVKKEDQWWLAGLPATGGTDPAAAPATVPADDTRVAALMATLANLRITGVAKTSPDFTQPQMVTLTVTGATSWRYELLHDGEHYYVRRDDRDTVFTLSASDYKALAEVDWQGMAAAPEKPEEAATAAPDK